MALDIHRNDKVCTYLYSLNDEEFAYFTDIFDQLYWQTGIKIDYYKDCGLSIDHQKKLVKLIDRYCDETDINKEKKKTISILSFRGFLEFTINTNWNLMLFSD